MYFMTYGMGTYRLEGKMYGRPSGMNPPLFRQTIPWTANSRCRKLKKGDSLHDMLDLLGQIVRYALSGSLSCHTDAGGLVGVRI